MNKHYHGGHGHKQRTRKNIIRVRDLRFASVTSVVALFDMSKSRGSGVRLQARRGQECRAGAEESEARDAHDIQGSSCGHSSTRIP